jgi:transposase-like protein
MLTTFADMLMPAEADAICGAPYGMPGPDRVNVRDGYRHRDSGTRAGTLDVAIPKLGRARISRTGCWNAAAARRRR